MLKCGDNLIKIKNWRWLNLFLRNGKKFTLFRITYILSFLINLMSLTCIKIRNIDWQHRSSKIQFRKIDEIIEYTKRINNNYQLNEIESFQTLWTTFSLKIDVSISIANWMATLESTLLTIDSFAIIDIWHRRIKYIELFELYKLEKKCLEVRLKGKSIS